MNSEKVKEIKKALEDNANYEHHNKLFYIDGYKCKIVDYADILTLINELESENERLIDQRNKTYNIWVKDTEKLKDRIAELENTDYYKEIEKKKEDLLCKEYGLIKYEKEIAGKYLKQFAERLKEKLEKYRLENEYFIKDEPNGNLWQLNSSVFYLEVTQDGGLVDETLKEYEK